MELVSQQWKSEVFFNFNVLHIPQSHLNFSLYYRKSSDFSTSPDLINGDGDGTVNLRSLEACMHWTTHQDANITTRAIPSVDHMSILSNHDAINYILGVLG
jgi:lysophospholipase III